MDKRVEILRSCEIRARNAGYCDLAQHYQSEANWLEKHPETVGLSCTDSCDNISYCITDKRDPYFDRLLLGEKDFQVARFKRLINSAAFLFMFHSGNLVAGAELMSVEALSAINNNLEDALNRTNSVVNDIMKAIYG